VERISNPGVAIAPREYLAGFTVVQRESTALAVS
jgi:hypothetical protein